MRKNSNIRSIYLFGSRARGNYSGYSDADLLLILGEDTRCRMDRLPDYLQLFTKAPVPVEVFPFTEQEVAKSAFAQQAVKEGILLHKR